MPKDIVGIRISLLLVRNSKHSNNFIADVSSVSPSSGKRAAIYDISPEGVVSVTHEQNVICSKTLRISRTFAVDNSHYQPS